MRPAELSEGMSSLKNMTGSIIFTNINGSSLKGMNQILRAAVLDIITKYIKTHGSVKLQLDVDFLVKDVKSHDESLFPTRTRQYEMLTEEDLKVGLVQMIAETKWTLKTKT